MREMRPPRNYFVRDIPAGCRDAFARGGQLVLDEPVSGARGTHGATGRCGTAALAGSIAGSGRGALEIFAGGAANAGGGGAHRSNAAGGYAGVQPEEFFVDRVVHRYGAREFAACARAVQLGDVGAAQPAVSGSDGRAAGRSVDAEVARIFPGGAGRGAPVSGNHRHNDEPRGRLAVHPTGTLCGARGYAGVADGDAFQAHGAACGPSCGKRGISWSGWDCCGLAWRSRRIARHIRRRYGRCASRNSCC